MQKTQIAVLKTAAAVMKAAHAVNKFVQSPPSAGFVLSYCA
jgi:hypothetical protein